MNTTEIDLVAIEKHARHLRATALRDTGRALINAVIAAGRSLLAATTGRTAH